MLKLRIYQHGASGYQAELGNKVSVFDQTFDKLERQCAYKDTKPMTLIFNGGT